MRTHHRILATPTGPFALTQFADGSIKTGWVHPNTELQGEPDSGLLPGLSARIIAYFGGEVVSFDDVPLPPATAFLRGCWAACRKIPRGTTISYAELARCAGGPIGAARAAGQAMRRNPQPIITPCHRVIGSSGNLHGFAGTTSRSSESLATKRFLLDLERDVVRQAAVA